MVKLAWGLMLTVVFAAQAEPNDVPGCIMANTGEVNAMVDEALLIYASVKGCEKGSPVHTCVADVAAVVNSALGVGKFLLKAFKTCGEIKTANFDCAIAAHALTADIAAVVQHSALASHDCKPPGDSFTQTSQKRDWDYGNKATCTADLGTGMADLQAAITSMMAVKGKCDAGNGAKCFAAVLDIISAVGNLGVFIETIVSACSSPIVTVNDPCETDIAGLLSALSGTASTALTISSKCTAASTRTYYQDYDYDAPSASNGGATLLSAILVVFLPITGVASYYGGSAFKTRRQSGRDILIPETSEFDSDVRCAE